MTDNEDRQSISLDGKKILWVEDDNFLGDLIARRLVSEKCQLIHVKTGEEALGYLENDRPSLVVLDILLPGIDGFEVLTRIKGDEKTKTVPVMILSNFGQKNDVERGKQLGASKFLLKATLTLDEIVKEVKDSVQ